MVKNKRGQEGLSPLIYVSIVVVVVLIAAGGIYYFVKAGKTANEADFTTFSSSLSKATRTNSAEFGAVDAMSFSLPKGSEEVCIVDREKPIDEFQNNELASVIDVFSDSNLFIKYNGQFKAFKAEGLKLEKESNPFCIKTGNGKLSLDLENKGTFKDVTSTNEKVKKDCTSVAYNGDSGKKLDIVFLASDYDKPEAFADDVNTYIEALKENEPFKANVNKMNFFRVDDIGSMKCTAGSGELISCDKILISRIASNCPNDIVILLHNDNFLSSARSSSYSNVIKVSVSDTRGQGIGATLHELGHAIGNLADEYEDDNYYKTNYPGFDPAAYPNCDVTGCAKWDGIPNTCIVGCSLSTGFYRSSPSSVMRELSTLNYGLVGREVMDKKVGNYG